MKFTTTAVALGLAAAAQAQLSAIPIVQAIAPGSASCANAPAATKDQCREAPAVANALVGAFIKYGIYSVNQMAAVTSLMAFESLDFVYKRNQGAGNFGQGTANMQSAEYNLKYAKTIPELQAQYANVDFGSMTPDDKEAMLTALMPDELNFGSGPWFLLTQCEAHGLPALLETDIVAGWDAYMTCIGVPTPLDPLRTEYWQRAKTAFGIQG